MSKWTIAKEFDFCYGHRVWSQVINQEYSIDNRCVCRHLHGHQGKVIVKLESDTLKAGMVTDFKHLNWFKKFLDETLDHKFVIDANDPMYRYIIPHYTHMAAEGPPPLKGFSEGYSIVNPNYFKTITDNGIIEILEGFVIVGFVPTSENFSRWLYGIVSDKMLKIGVKTHSVVFMETPKTSSTFSINS